MPKRPKQRASIATEKRPRSIPVARDGQIAISFSMFDHAPEWSRSSGNESQFPGVARKLKAYESMRWSDITVRDHRVLVSRLISQAQRRLSDLRLDDVDELWRLRLDGRKRLWGVRVRDCFYVLWWDPGHAVCPSNLKHT